MTAAELVVKIKADIDDLMGKLATAAAEVDAFAKSAEDSSGRSSSAFKDTEKSLNDLDRASKAVRDSMNGSGPGGLYGAIGEVIGGALKLGAVAQRGAADLGMWMQQTDQGATAMTGFGAALSSAAPFIGPVVAGIMLLAAVLLGIPALAGLAQAALVLLADTAGTLGAIVYAALGPLGLLVAILGGLAGAFYLAAQKALTLKSGAFGALHQDISNLKSEFGDLTHQLAVDFLPIFTKLAGAAQIALGYLDKLAHMPLNQAMESLAHQGMNLLTKFMEGAAHIVANPLRLAIQIAFGGGGQHVQNQIGGMLSQLGGYLFGKEISVPVTAHRGAANGAAMIPKFQPGALSPILKWFNSQDFTKTGMRWGNEIVNGIENSGILHRLGQWILTVLGDAARKGGHEFVSVLKYEIVNALPNLMIWMGQEFEKEAKREALAVWQQLSQAWTRVKSDAQKMWSSIASNAEAEWHHITSNATSAWDSLMSGLERNWHSFTSTLGGAMQSAWNHIKGIAEGVWNTIVSFIEKPLSININWPSPPGWLSSLMGGAGGLLGGIGGAASSFLHHHAAAGGIITRPTTLLAGESGAEAIIPLTGGNGRNALGAMGGGGGDVHIHLAGATFLSGGRPAAREMARILKPQLERIVNV